MIYPTAWLKFVATCEGCGHAFYAHMDEEDINRGWHVAIDPAYVNEDGHCIPDVDPRIQCGPINLDPKAVLDRVREIKARFVR